MRLITLFVVILISASLQLSEAKMEENIFEIDIKLYTAQEIKALFPSMELGTPGIEIDGIAYESPGTSSNYLFGWIKLRRDARNAISGKLIPACKITAWNKFFNYAFTVTGITEGKSYFLIPLGSIAIPDRDIEYRLSPS